MREITPSESHPCSLLSVLSAWHCALSVLRAQLQVDGSQWSSPFALDSEAKHFIQLQPAPPPPTNPPTPNPNPNPNPISALPSTPRSSARQLSGTQGTPGSQSTALSRTPSTGSLSSSSGAHSSGSKRRSSGAAAASRGRSRMLILADVVHGGGSCHYHVILRRAPAHGPYM